MPAARPLPPGLARRLDGLRDRVQARELELAQARRELYEAIRSAVTDWGCQPAQIARAAALSRQAVYDALNHRHANGDLPPTRPGG